MCLTTKYFPVFTQTTGMTHFQEWHMLCFTTVTVPPYQLNDMQCDFCTVLSTYSMET